MKPPMIRTSVLALLGLTVAGHAAPQPERVRGTVVSANDTTLVIKGQDGQARTVALTPDTKYLNVVKSSLDRVSDGKFIGTATKGEPPVALEVVIFPPAMKGGGKAITVTYGSGGQQEITVPPTAPIVEFEPADKSVVKPGAAVFANATKDGETLTARAVAVGKDGVVPPM